MENLKDYLVAGTFILITSTLILLFALNYPAINGHNSPLMDNDKFNKTAGNLTTSLGGYQNSMNLNINISTEDEPQAVGDSFQLATTTTISRNIVSQITESFKILTTFLGGIFGLSGSQFMWVAGSLISLLIFIGLFYIIKMIRVGA